MKPSILILLAVEGLILVAVVLAWLWQQWAVLDTGLPWLAMVLRVLLFSAPPVYVGALVWRRWGDHRYIQAHHVTQLTRAQTQVAPQATSFTYHDAHQISAPAAPALALPAAEAAPVATVPTFAQLLDQGKFGTGRPLLLGFDAETGAPIEGSWRDLYSCGIGALQGAGKSWLCAFLLAQSAAAGGRLIICDPHAGADESLANRIGALAPAFMCDVASTDDEILAALRLANDKLEKRRVGKGGEWEILVAVDEWSSLLRGKLGDELPALVQNITEQGRKYHTNALLSAQGWTVDAAGIVRNRLTAHYVLRQRDAEARYQLGLKSAQLPGDIRTLPDAAGYLLTVRGDLTKVIIPKMTSTDLARVGELIDRPAPARPALGFTAPTAPLTPIVVSGKATGRQPEGKTELPSTASQPARAASPEAARAASLFLDGKSPQEIATELRGVNSTAGGRKYQAALNEVIELIRQGVQS